MTPEKIIKIGKSSNFSEKEIGLIELCLFIDSQFQVIKLMCELHPEIKKDINIWTELNNSILNAKSCVEREFEYLHPINTVADIQNGKEAFPTKEKQIQWINLSICEKLNWIIDKFQNCINNNSWNLIWLNLGKNNIVNAIYWLNVLLQKFNTISQ